jgi:hypothetical protein
MIGGGADPQEASANPEPWPLDWRALDPADRRWWFEVLWERVCGLRHRYRLPVRSRWWEDSIQVEALAATAAWVARYDECAWDDPPGKLALLFELDRVQTLLRGGHEPFDPIHDRHAFERHLATLGSIRCTDAAPTAASEEERCR